MSCDAWPLDESTGTTMRIPTDVILAFVRWCMDYQLSYRHLEEITEGEREVSVDHSSINRSCPFPASHRAGISKNKRAVSASWRTDETHVKVKASEIYLPRCRQAAKEGRFLLTEKRKRGPENELRRSTGPIFPAKAGQQRDRTRRTALQSGSVLIMITM